MQALQRRSRHALGPFGNGSIEEFLAALEAAPKGSPVWRIAQAQDFWDSIFSLLVLQLSDTEPPYFRPTGLEIPPGGEKTNVYFPNLPPAICWSNRAQALLKMGAAEEALENAVRN